MKVVFASGAWRAISASSSRPKSTSPGAILRAKAGSAAESSKDFSAPDRAPSRAPGRPSRRPPSSASSAAEGAPS
ncbi:Uncharacterised protein [Mycobacteroides abscessus subsp. abscessus]|nr:Uncharacterised protein [Mycobacteroides abscessus subsp. abscessus]